MSSNARRPQADPKRSGDLDGPGTEQRRAKTPTPARDSLRWIWMPVPRESASSRAPLQQLGSSERQPFDTDHDLDAPVGDPV